MTGIGYLSQVRMASPSNVKCRTESVIFVTDGWPYGTVHGLQLLVIH